MTLTFSSVCFLSEFYGEHSILHCLLMLVLWQICVCLQEWFAVYVELNQQIAALLSAGEEEEVVELKALQQQLSDVCYRQASQLEGRQNVLQAAQSFHSTTQEVKYTHTHTHTHTRC